MSTPDNPQMPTFDPNVKSMLMTERLIALQGAIPEIEKTKSVDAGGKKYKHVELDKFMGIVLPIIRSHQYYLSFHTLQTTPIILSDSVVHVGYEQARLTCAITGLYTTSDVPLLVRLESRSVYNGTVKVTENNLMQGLGSAVTYAKRYALFDVLGLVPEVDSDDDGRASSNQENKKVHISYQDRVNHLSDSVVPTQKPSLSVEEQMELMENIRVLFELKQEAAFKNNEERAERIANSIRMNFKDIEAKHLVAYLHRYTEFLSEL